MLFNLVSANISMFYLIVLPSEHLKKYLVSLSSNLALIGGRTTDTIDVIVTLSLVSDLKFEVT